MQENPYQSPSEASKSAALGRDLGGHRKKYVSQKQRLRYRTVAVAISVPQLFICAVLAFGDIGFDHPGRFGLDFGHFLFFLGAQAGLIVLSLVLPIVWRRWRLLLIPAVFVPLTYLAYRHSC